MYIKRTLERELRYYIPKKEILAIVGPRQSGKTTIMKHIFKDLNNAVFLNFEDRETLESFNNDIKGFIDAHVKNKKFVFIDEFQYAKEGGKQLKYIYDTQKVKIIISGSSASGLSVHGIKYLVGRVLVFNLFPFSFEEFLSHKNPDLFSLYKKKTLSETAVRMILPLFNEYCIYGGFPRVILSDTLKEKEDILRNIYNTYFLKEIKEILNLPEDYKLSKLIKALSLQTGNIINYNELSDISGFNYKELLSHLNILEKTFVTQRSQPYYTNKRTELVKAPKIFFVDNGFRNICIKNFQPLKERPDKGQLYENFVAVELVKKDIDLKYWRTKSKAEVDFVVEKNGHIIPIEVKSELKTPKTTKSFSSFLEKYKPRKSLFLSESVYGRKRGTDYRPIFAVSKEISDLG